MFKIENYITPIITNYLTKYVKNFRSQDFQMSLWEGEVALQNLDLRLDVLKKELHLPFELLSGHIHELIIQVPWTKITSEPIRIKINTIEFVLGSTEGHKEDDNKFLKKAHLRSEGVATNGAPRVSVTTNKKNDEAHISSITKAIINNLNFRCENVIFKYIELEQDVAFLMNLHLFNISSANEKWNEAVEDINAPKVISRKIISILHLSFYLDKHNSSHQVDACHEPLLYRCSLFCRVLRSFSAQTKDKCSITRIAVFTNAINLNLSPIQIPVLMRFIKAILTLTGSGNKVHEMIDPCQNQNKEPPLCIGEDNVIKSESKSQNQTSYFSWAWNLMPTLLSSGIDEEEEDFPGHINEFGIYIQQLNLKIKNSEYATDASVGGAKIVKYKQIIQLTLKGMYFETVTVKEIDWKNIKVGVSKILLIPLDPDKKKVDSDVIFKLGSTKRKVKHKRAFLEKSLFDDNYRTPEKELIVTNYEDYTKTFTDTYLLYRSPALGFDQVEYCSNIDEMDEEIEPATSTSTKKRCLRKQIRVIGTGVVLRYNETCLKKEGQPTFEFSKC